MVRDLGDAVHLLFRTNHVRGLRDYGLRTHLGYVFNWNLSRIVITFQMELRHLPPIVSDTRFRVIKLSHECDADASRWAEIINASYPDRRVSPDSLRVLRARHPYLAVEQTLGLVDESEAVVGTVSVGHFRDNPRVASECMLAVLPKAQGRGAGQHLRLSGFHLLRDRGYELLESKIQFNRDASIAQALKLGLQPQYDRQYWNHDVQRRLWPARAIAHLSIRRRHRRYRAELAQRFRSDEGSTTR